MKFYTLIFTIPFLILHSCKDERKNEPQEIKKEEAKFDKIIKEASKSDNINIGNLNFEFDLPQGWYRIDTAIQNVKVTFLKKDKNEDNFTPIINVTNEFMHNTTAEEYIKIVKNQSIAGENEFLKDGTIDVLNKNCLWYIYTSIQKFTRREIIFYSIPINGISYNISAGVNIGGMDKYKPIFDQITKSFKLNNDTKASLKE